MPHLLPIFVRTFIQHYEHFLKSDSNFADKATSQAIIKRWFKKPENTASDAPNNYLQRRMRLQVVDELMEIVGACPYFGSTYLVRIRFCSRNSSQPCLDPPKSEWHGGQRQIMGTQACIGKDTAGGVRVLA